MPRVTVIIPPYNWSTVLPYSIGSVLDQTFTDFELLVIGDGCTDDSEAVVARATRRAPPPAPPTPPPRPGPSAPPKTRGPAPGRAAGTSRISDTTISGCRTISR